MIALSSAGLISAGLNIVLQACSSPRSSARCFEQTYSRVSTIDHSIHAPCVLLSSTAPGRHSFLERAKIAIKILASDTRRSSRVPAIPADFSPVSLSNSSQPVADRQKRYPTTTRIPSYLFFCTHRYQILPLSRANKCRRRRTAGISHG